MDQPEMDEFEYRLASELRRVSAPDGFTAGVLEQIKRLEQPKQLEQLKMQRRRRLRWGQVWLAAAVLLAMLFGGAGVQWQHRRHAREQAARQQFDLAMQVTGRSIHQAELVIRGTGVTFIEEER